MGKSLSRSLGCPMCGHQDRRIAGSPYNILLHFGGEIAMISPESPLVDNPGLGGLIGTGQREAMLDIPLCIERDIREFLEGKEIKIEGNFMEFISTGLKYDLDRLLFSAFRAKDITTNRALDLHAKVPLISGNSLSVQNILQEELGSHYNKHKEKKTVPINIIPADSCLLEHAQHFALVTCNICKKEVCLDCHLFERTEHLHALEVRDELVNNTFETHRRPEGHFSYTTILKDFGNVLIEKRPVYIANKGDYLMKILKLQLLDYGSQCILLKIMISKKGTNPRDLLEESQNEFFLLELLEDYCVQIDRRSQVVLGFVLETTMNYFGDPLLRSLPTGAIPQREMINLYQQLTQAISHFHSQGVFILDINPETILYNRETKQIRFCHLIEATHYSDPSYVTNKRVPFLENMRSMNLGYLAPEILKAVNQKDPKAPIILGALDVYSLAMMMLQLMTRLSHAEMRDLKNKRNGLMNAREAEAGYEEHLDELLDLIDKARRGNKWTSSINMVLSLLINSLDLEPSYRMPSHYLYLMSTLVYSYMIDKPTFFPHSIDDYLSLLDKRSTSRITILEGRQHDTYKHLNNLVRDMQKARNIYNLDEDCRREFDLCNHDKALIVCREAIQLARALYTQNSPVYHELLVGLAAIYYEIGDYSLAKDHYMQALDIGNIIFPQTHPEVALTLSSIALCYDKLGDFEQAHNYFHLDLKMRTAIEGGELFPKGADIFWRLGDNRRLAGDYEKAISYYQKALPIKALRLGIEHPSTWRTIMNLGKAAFELSIYEQAYRYLKLCLLIINKINIPAYKETKLKLLRLLQEITHYHMGSIREANEYYMDYIKIKRNKQIETSIYWDIAHIAFYLGNTRSAKSYLREGMAQIAKKKEKGINDEEYIKFNERFMHFSDTNALQGIESGKHFVNNLKKTKFQYQ